MGAITFSIDPLLVEALTEATAFDLFVETGTYQGASIERVRPYVPQVISIEQSEPYYQAAVARFQEDEAVTLIHGDSAETLTDLQPQLEGQAILFWLDAHWCADEQTAGVTSQCPLLRELAALGSLHPGSVVLIDDARYFLAPPGQPHEVAQWPVFAEVLEGLRHLGADHELLVVNDVLVYHPRSLRLTLRTFAHAHGVDWLSMVDRSREHDRLLREVEEKEAAIKEIHAAAEERLARIQAFEKEEAHTASLLQAKDTLIASQQREFTAQQEAMSAHEETRATLEQVITSLQREPAALKEMVQGLRDLQAAQEAAIQALGEKMAARDHLVAVKDEMLATQEELIRDKETVIQALKQAQDARADELLAQRATIATKEAALTAREEQLAAADEALSARDEAMQSKATVLAARAEQLASQQAGIEAKEREIAALQEKLAAHKEIIQGLEREQTNQRTLLASQRTIIETREEAVANYQRALATKERELAVKDELLAYKEQEVEQKEEHIQVQHQELIEKEAVIHELDRFRRSSLGYWFTYRLGGLLRRLVGVPLRPARTLLRPRLGTLEQHPPRPLKIPQRYQATRCTVDAPPTISVVTPAYNHADYLERTIQSVLNQPYPHLEYIIQDGGSTDATGEILDRYRAQCAHVASKADRGQAHAINLGFAHASGEIMAWLNSDDLLLPGALPYIANYFTRHPDVDVVYGHRVLIDEADQEIGRWVLPRHDEDILNWADYVPQETLFWRRRIWENAGGQVDESFQFALDWDLLLRFQEAGAKMVCLPRFLGAFRVYAAQKTLDWADVGEAEMALLRQRAHGRAVSWAEINAHVDPYVRRAVHRHLLYRAGLLRL